MKKKGWGLALLQKPLGLTEDEKKDLIAFLHSLTDAKFQKKKTVK